ncbi:MAG: GtrA family protein [Candidatus Velthaea sp.]
MSEAAPSFVTRLTQRRGLRQFVKFGIVGASGFVVNFVIFTALQRVDAQHALGAHYYVIYSVAFLSGGVSNYFLNRMWTFRSSGHAGREGAQFLTVSVMALAVGLFVSWIVQPYFGHGHKTWFISTLAGIFINFFVNKYWTFRAVD